MAAQGDGRQRGVAFAAIRGDLSGDGISRPGAGQSLPSPNVRVVHAGNGTCGSVPQTVFVPAGIGHAFKNPEDSGSDMMLIAYADRQYEPTDTIALKVL